MEYLDANVDVVSYEYEKLVIEYVSNVKTGRKRRYFPDFFIKYADGRTEVIEIKPLRRSMKPAVIKKSHAAIEWCLANNSRFVIVTEVELKKLGLI